jgi:hypothetical protein
MRVNELSPEALAALKVLPLDVQKQVAKTAIEKTNKFLIEMFRSFVPVRTGALLNSVGMKVKGYENGKIQFGVVGARSDYQAAIVTVHDREQRRLRRITKNRPVMSGQRTIKPSKYLHLVEDGTKPRHTKSGKSTGTMPAFHFMREIEQATIQQARDVFENEIFIAINRL